jgi:hypothetical protein
MAYWENAGGTFGGTARENLLDERLLKHYVSVGGAGVEEFLLKAAGRLEGGGFTQGLVKGATV